MQNYFYAIFLLLVQLPAHAQENNTIRSQGDANTTIESGGESRTTIQSGGPSYTTIGGNGDASVTFRNRGRTRITIEAKEALDDSESRTGAEYNAKIEELRSQITKDFGYTSSCSDIEAESCLEVLQKLIIVLKLPGTKGRGFSQIHLSDHFDPVAIGSNYIYVDHRASMKDLRAFIEKQLRRDSPEFKAVEMEEETLRDLVSKVKETSGYSCSCSSLYADRADCIKSVNALLQALRDPTTRERDFTHIFLSENDSKTDLKGYLFIDARRSSDAMRAHILKQRLITDPQVQQEIELRQEIETQIEEIRSESGVNTRCTLGEHGVDGGISLEECLEGLQKLSIAAHDLDPSRRLPNIVVNNWKNVGEVVIEVNFRASISNLRETLRGVH